MGRGGWGGGGSQDQFLWQNLTILLAGGASWEGGGEEAEFLGLRIPVHCSENTEDFLMVTFAEVVLEPIAPVAKNF